MKTNMDHWWNGTDRGKSKYLEKNRSQSHAAHEKSHVDCPEIETGPSRWQAGSKRNILWKLYLNC